ETSAADFLASSSGGGRVVVAGNGAASSERGAHPLSLGGGVGAGSGNGAASSERRSYAPSAPSSGERNRVKLGKDTAFVERRDSMPSSREGNGERSGNGSVRSTRMFESEGPNTGALGSTAFTLSSNVGSRAGSGNVPAHFKRRASSSSLSGVNGVQPRNAPAPAKQVASSSSSSGGSRAGFGNGSVRSIGRFESAGSNTGALGSTDSTLFAGGVNVVRPSNGSVHSERRPSAPSLGRGAREGSGKDTAHSKRRASSSSLSGGNVVRPRNAFAPAPAQQGASSFSSSGRIGGRPSDYPISSMASLWPSSPPRTHQLREGVAPKSALLTPKSQCSAGSTAASPAGSPELRGGSDIPPINLFGSSPKVSSTRAVAKAASQGGLGAVWGGESFGAQREFSGGSSYSAEEVNSLLVKLYSAEDHNQYLSTQLASAEARNQELSDANDANDGLVNAFFTQYEEELNQWINAETLEPFFVDTEGRYENIASFCKEQLGQCLKGIDTSLSEEERGSMNGVAYLRKYFANVTEIIFDNIIQEGTDITAGGAESTLPNLKLNRPNIVATLGGAAIAKLQRSAQCQGGEAILVVNQWREIHDTMEAAGSIAISDRVREFGMLMTGLISSSKISGIDDFLKILYQEIGNFEKKYQEDYDQVQICNIVNLCFLDLLNSACDQIGISGYPPGMKDMIKGCFDRKEASSDSIYDNHQMYIDAMYKDLEIDVSQKTERGM
ncbi:MAG: hypothetical protein HON23_05495, partial [Rickettsiales bacterium]|nr:hypothetical protein [Rickettsiales bacterium]